MVGGLRLACVLLLFVWSGCADKVPPPAASEFLAEARFTNAEGDQYDSAVTLETVPHAPIDFLVSFQPLNPSRTELEGRKIRSHEDWRIRPEFHQGGERIYPEQPGVPEVYPFDLATIEYGNGDRILWRTPDPPKEEAGRDHFWGHVRAPESPGEYEIVVLLHPTADPLNLGDYNPAFGPGIRILQLPLRVREPQDGESIEMPTYSNSGLREQLLPPPRGR